MIPQRFFAFLIDKLIIAIILSTLWFISVYEVKIILFFIIAGCYFSYFDSSKMQGTIGKKLLGIKVVNTSGNTLKIKEAFFKICSLLHSKYNYNTLYNKYSCNVL